MNRIKLFLLVIFFLSTMGGLTSLHSQQKPTTVDKSYSRYDSSSNAIDTLSRVFQWATYTKMSQIFNSHYRFILVPDSTIYLSQNPLFPSDSTFIIKGGESYTSEQFDRIVANWYVKGKGNGKFLLRRQVSGF